MWKQELMWVKRNSNNVIVQLSDTPPKNGDFVPYMPMPLRRDPAQYAKRKNSNPAR
jgi:hypothetical protein